MDRKPKPYTESAENAEKSLIIRKCLMTGHVMKDQRRARLDAIVEQYTNDAKGMNNFLVEITEWMISWYDTLAANSHDLAFEYKELAATLARTVEHLDLTDPHTDVSDTEDKAITEVAAYRKRIEENNSMAAYWNKRRQDLAHFARLFVQDFRSTDH